jgi:hypothetical protein
LAIRFIHDPHGFVSASIADIHARTGDQLGNFRFASTAEGTSQLALEHETSSIAGLKLCVTDNVRLKPDTTVDYRVIVLIVPSCSLAWDVEGGLDPFWWTPQ